MLPPVAYFESILSGFQIGNVGFSTPIALLGIPLAAVLLFYLVFRRGSVGETNWKRRIILFSSRFLIVLLLLTAAAGPYTLEERVTPGDPQVKILVDESNSMAVYSSGIEDLARQIESNGVRTSIIEIASENTSRIGDKIVSNMVENGTLLLFTDGQVTSGKSLQQAGITARSINTEINVVSLSTQQTETSVAVLGPSKVSNGVQNRFLVQVNGINIDGNVTVDVEVDGEQVASERVNRSEGQFGFSHTFEETGDHRIRAEINTNDRFESNNVFYKTVSVVEKPRILYVTRSNHPLQKILTDLYEVDISRSIPENLDKYYAVVIQDMAADDLGNLNALQEFVVDGNGVVVIGGPNSYEKGGYGSSSISNMLPVSIGESRRSSNLVLLIDISGSTQDAMSTQKALALDVVDQLGDQNRVGLVVFNENAYKVTELQPLSTSRSSLRNKIRRLKSGGATFIHTGLRGAGELLGNREGNVILITDGVTKNPEPAYEQARRLQAKDIRVITIGVGDRTNKDIMRKIAEAGGGTFFSASDINRLKVLFGEKDGKPENAKLTVVDSGHFITAGVEPQSNPPNANSVSVRKGADFLVASGTGDPAIVAWRYGLGRVVSITAYDNQGNLDGLLSQPDSVLLSRSINWAIGDPERKQSDLLIVPDTRVGEETQLTYFGESRPSASGIGFSRVDENKYRASLIPSSTGFKTILDTEYAVNYPRELSSFGVSESLKQVVQSTGGRIYSMEQASEIASQVKSRSTQVREVRNTWDWILISVALLLYLMEVMVRRLYEIYGYRMPRVGGA